MACVSILRTLGVLLYIFNTIHYLNADGVFGCGGFVKSDVDINYSLVEVKLYTPHGSIKYQTDCAPNTGYYLIPLYDKGDFTIKVEPPKGWSFEPESVDLHIDGMTDKCSLSEDINFKFTGFSIQGKVISKGEVTGPQGVTVSLGTAGTKQALQTVITSSDGSFSFSKILPGDYIVRATHPTWKLETGETDVSIVNDNANTGSSLVIRGYDVSGSVSSDGSPVGDVNFILFSEKIKKKDVSGCLSAPIKGFSSSLGQPLCHVTSEKNGIFRFDSLPPGQYTIVPFYKGEHITFDVKPARLEFTVQHQSVKLKEGFQITGFSVLGKVLDSNKGNGINKAKIFLNGKAQTVTGVDGVYQLENMKPGTFTLTVESVDIFFDETVVKISPNTPRLPDIIATEFNLCGEVIINRIPEGLSQIPTQRKIIYYPQGRGSEAATVTTGTDGKFCARVKSGTHVVKVHVSENELKAGLLLAPVEQVVTATNKPVLGIKFHQFRAKVSGAVACMEKCSQIDVSLDSLARSDSKQVVQVQDGSKGATFTFENVLPGKYKVSILQDSWCWKSKSIEIDALDKDLTGVDFTQTGYILKCSISHEITLNFAHEKKSGSGSFQLNKGTNRFCLAQPGVYRLTPDSCHKFEKDVYTYDTLNPLMVTLTAVRHIVYGSVTSQTKMEDIILTISSSASDIPTILGPLTTDVPTDKESKAPAKGPFVYKFSHWARTGEKLTFKAKSSELLFSPATIEATIHGDLCPGEVANFEGKLGVFILVQIKPALSGVHVTVSAQEEAVMEPIVQVTDATGKFKVGPLHGAVEYMVYAQKEGYLLTKEEGQQAVFRAFKLGEVDVKITDEKKQGLANVLLSLSGGNQYRSNNLTAESGAIKFSALSPGQYFLRPMMKEYKFEPASQMIDVKEGSALHITITSKRVAYSCYGRVTSLNGEPESGAIVEAVGQGKCSENLEESKTEQDGTYRIRGLEPKCVYIFRLKGGNVNAHLARTAPASRTLEVDNSDFYDVNVIAFRHITQMDISGNIRGPQEHLSSLKVLLYREDQPDSPIHTLKIGVSSFFYLPSLPIDNTGYNIRLACSLQKNLFAYVLPEVQFIANKTFQHFTIAFEPKRKSFEQELSTGSFLLLPLLFGAAYLFYNYKKVMPFVSHGVDQLQSVIKQIPQFEPMAAASDNGQEVTSVTKKKSKPRKA